jgi:PPOX class probable FMN-dependent enzyme
VNTITSLDDLLALYDQPVETSILKEIDAVSPLHQRYIEASPFVLVASSGPGGIDCSPRGDPAGFVAVADPKTLHLPDRRGNNRLDTLRNLVLDPRIGLLFLIPGVGVTLRVNGTATISTDAELLDRYTMAGKRPTTVVVVHVESVYTQCPKAIIRAGLWDPARHRDPDTLPTVGEIMSFITAGAFDGPSYDAAYPERIRTTIY